MKAMFKIILVIVLFLWLSCCKQNDDQIKTDPEIDNVSQKQKTIKVISLDGKYLYLQAEDKDSYFIDEKGQPFLICGEIDYDQEGTYPVILKYLTPGGRIIEIDRTVVIGDLSSDGSETVADDHLQKTEPVMKPAQEDPIYGPEYHHVGNVQEDQQKGHYEKRKVLVREAWTEEVLVSAGYWEDILISAPWDEEITYCLVYGQDTQDMYVCTQCSYQTADYEQIKEHMAEFGHSYTYTSVPVGDQKCLSYDTYVKHHEAVYDSIWHEAVYETVEHPAEYIYEEYWVSD